MRVRYIIEGLLLLILWLLMWLPGGGEWYAGNLYPVIARFLSGLSGCFPFSLSDCFIYGSIAGLLLYAVVRIVRRKPLVKTGLNLLEYLVCTYLFFYFAWGLNYSRDGFYERSGYRSASFSEEQFLNFLQDYTEALNASYTPVTETVDYSSVAGEVKNGYRKLDARFCLLGVDGRGSPKPMLFPRLMSGVGVLGYVGAFFNEYHINPMLLPQQVPFTYAHEMAHVLGVSGEGEANFYAFLVCSASENRFVRFSGYYSLLPYVASSVLRLLGEESFARWKESLLPEIRTLYVAERDYWASLYYPSVGKMQDAIYHWFLKSNRVEGGTKNYSEVVGMLISHFQTEQAG